MWGAGRLGLLPSLPRPLLHVIFLSLDAGLFGLLLAGFSWLWCVVARVGGQPAWLSVSCLRDGPGELSRGCTATRLLVVASVLAGMSAFVTGTFLREWWVGVRDHGESLDGDVCGRRFLLGDVCGVVINV